MKQAKTLSLILAIVLAFVFISSPADVFSAGGDEHPWDEEYITNEERDNSTNGTAGASDTTLFVQMTEWITITGDGDGEGDGDPFFDWFWNYSSAMLYFQYLDMFGGLPPAGQSSTNVDGVQDDRPLTE
jgi:hypothetical protein